jgi:hypothetical protein
MHQVNSSLFLPPAMMMLQQASALLLPYPASDPSILIPALENLLCEFCKYFREKIT